VLVIAAIALAFAAGIGVAAVIDDLRRLHFGWRQVLTLVPAAGLVLAMLGFAADTPSGRFALGADDWASTYAWMNDTPAAGGFRVLWVGDPNILPADGKHAGKTGYALTNDGAGDARASWAAPESRADSTLARAITAAATGSTSRLGHLLAPAGVRYIAFLTRAAPKDGAYGAPAADVGDALARQLDLTLERADDASTVYRNDAWIPVHALAPSDRTTDDATQAEPTGVSPVGEKHGRTDPIGPGTLLWAEASSARWHATADGRTVDRHTAFAATNAFTLGAHVRVSVRYRANPMLALLRALAIALWIAVAIAWVATRRVRADAS
jgi:hypothetical protein